MMSSEAEKNPIPGYQILAKLGEGGMGAVYKARQISLDRTVAIKILSPRLAKSRDYTERFLREARIAGQLNHVNIVSAIDVGGTDKYYYIVMEYVDGDTLRKIVQQKGVLDEENALHVTMQIARALAWAHRNGIVHRDVKPDNIMVNAEGIAKLCDLGLAKQEDAEAAMLTQSGMMVGTPHYVSPEQARGERDLDGRTDIYSLGATLYHAVTGKPPFGGTSAAVVMTKHLTEQVPWPSEVNPMVSENLSLLIQKMMAKDRNDRYRSADELVRDMEFVIDGKAPDSEVVDAHKSSVAGVAAAGAGAAKRGAAAEAARRRISAKKKPVGLIAGIAGGVAAVTILIAVFASRSGDGPPARPAPVSVDRVVATDDRPDPERPGGKTEELFEYAAKWEKDHPEEYDDAISRYGHVVKYAAGTVWEMKARDAIETLTGRRDEAVGREFAALAARADTLAGTGDYDGATAVYADLPAKYEKALRPRADESVAALGKEAEAKIRAAVNVAEKFSADGEPEKGLAEMDKLAAVKYAALSGKIVELRARLEKERENVADLARRKAEAGAREKLVAAWDAFDEKILAGDLAGAKAALDSARRNESLKPMGETIEKWGALVAGFEEAAAAEKTAGDKLKSLVGTEVVLDTTRGKRKGKVKAVTAGDITLEHEFRINNQSGWTIMKVKLAELTEEEKARLMPVADPKTADGWLAKAAAAMGTKDVAAAETALAKAGSHPLAGHYKEKLDVLRLGETEAAARKAWEEVETLVAGMKEWNKTTGAKLLERLKAFEKEHAASELGKEKAAELAALIERAEDAATGFNIRKVFKGTVESFDQATREIVLSYAFDKEEELDDWDGGPDCAVIKDGKVLSSDGSKGFTRILNAAFEGDLTMETVSVTRLGHAGKWWMTYRPAGDKGKGGRAGTDFRSIFGPEPGYTKGAEEKFDYKFEAATKFYRHELKFEGSTIHYSVDGKLVKSFAPLSFPAERDDQRPGYNVGGYGFAGIDSFRVRGRLSKEWFDRKVRELKARSGGGQAAAGTSGAGTAALQKIFKGKVQEFDPKTGAAALFYDFKDPGQEKDWEMNGKMGVKDGRLVALAPGDVGTAVHRARFDGDFEVTFEATGSYWGEGAGFSIRYRKDAAAGQWESVGAHPVGADNAVVQVQHSGGGREMKPYPLKNGVKYTYRMALRDRVSFWFDGKELVSNWMPEHPLKHNRLYSPTRFGQHVVLGMKAANLGFYNVRIKGTLQKQWLKENLR
ncbi:serine/threonine protein kinase [Planctomycetota bacterium]